ncbi:MAG TPA: formyltransferase family protein [Candidatus Acidoferrales bacterium]|nr:formyltransferase family protein [Candidatus Acidoferrales bacterium]
MKTYLREKCGVVGVWSADDTAPYIARRASASLQHRGQESAGLSVLNPDGKISTYKKMGLVPHVLTESVLKKLGPGHTAIAQNRYATFGGSHEGNAQPIAMLHGKYQLSLGHNGNIPTVSNIRHQLSSRFAASGDTELMTALIHKERKNHKNWVDTLMDVLPQFNGAYSLTILTNNGSIFGVRDPYGIRPLCLGQFENGWIIASESAAIDAIGADFIREVKPGEIIRINKKGQLTSFFFGEPKRPQYCLFECVYFDRPDSFVNGIRIRAGREASGHLLGKRMKEKGIIPDVVVPTFDSGYPAAKGVAHELGIPMVDAITTSHYVGRTFIQPGQNNRITAVNGKHNIVPDEIRGKKVVIVDDSGVRLTTSTALVKKFREAGVKEIFIAFASPPVVDQCDLGIDMRAKNELPAAKFEKEPFDVIEQKVADHVKADAVVYLPIEETTKAFGGKPKDFYWTPFGGPHPIRGKQEEFPKKKHKITGKPKISIFISGSGTNLQVMIDAIESGDLDAQIVSVVSNNPDAYGLTRAKKHKIPTFVLPYQGKRTDKTERMHYEEQLMQHINKVKPDLIQLAGWNFIFGDTFLKEAQAQEIPVINQHPALLSSDDAKIIKTSQGIIPVFRGAHVITDPFTQGLPVSGFTVHQILPDNEFDVGPVVLKAEVHRHPDDTSESWEKRIRETEYLFLPTAVKRVLHVLRSGIDVSRGTFPWGK